MFQISKQMSLYFQGVLYVLYKLAIGETAMLITGEYKLAKLPYLKNCEIFKTPPNAIQKCFNFH